MKMRKIFLLLLVTMLFIGSASASTIYNASADSYGRTQSPDGNYGASTSMTVDSNSGIVDWTESYVKFGDFTTSDNCILNLYQGSGSTAEDFVIYPITSVWDEGTVTYNTRPTYTTDHSITGNFPASGGSPQWLQINISDLHSHWDSNTNYGIIILPTSGAGFSGFSTKEAGANFAYIEDFQPSTESIDVTVTRYASPLTGVVVNDEYATGGEVDSFGQITLEPTINDNKTHTINLEGEFSHGLTVQLDSTADIETINFELTGVSTTVMYYVVADNVVTEKMIPSSMVYSYTMDFSDGMTLELRPIKAGNSGGSSSVTTTTTETTEEINTTETIEENTNNETTDVALFDSITEKAGIPFWILILILVGVLYYITRRNE